MGLVIELPMGYKLQARFSELLIVIKAEENDIFL